MPQYCAPDNLVAVRKCDYRIERDLIGATLMIGKLGLPELLILALLALLIFGPSKIGDLGKALGDGIRGFKSAIRDEERTDIHG